MASATALSTCLTASAALAPISLVLCWKASASSVIRSCQYSECLSGDAGLSIISSLSLVTASLFEAEDDPGLMRLLAIEPTAEPKVFASPPQSAERWTVTADPREACVAAAATARVEGSARLTAETVTGALASGMEPDQEPDPPDGPPVEPETGRTGNGGVEGREPKARRWTGGGVAEVGAADARDEVAVVDAPDVVVVVGMADVADVVGAADPVVPAAVEIGAGAVGIAIGIDVGVSADRWIGIDVGGIGAVPDWLPVLVPALLLLVVPGVPGIAGAVCVVVLRSLTGARWTVGVDAPGGANPGIDPGGEPKDVGPAGSGWTDDGPATGARPAIDGNAGFDPTEGPPPSGMAARCTGVADDGIADGVDAAPLGADRDAVFTIVEKARPPSSGAVGVGTARTMGVAVASGVDGVVGAVTERWMTGVPLEPPAADRDTGVEEDVEFVDAGVAGADGATGSGGWA